MSNEKQQCNIGAEQKIFSRHWGNAIKSILGDCQVCFDDPSAIRCHLSLDSKIRSLTLNSLGK